MTLRTASVHTLYRFWAADGALLYIGLTMDPPTRFKAHAKKKEWWQLVTSITIEHFADRVGLVAGERVAIMAERPRYNIIHNSPKVAESSVRTTRPTTHRKGLNNNTPVRAIRVSGALWRSFGDAAERAGTKRSTVLVEFIRWVIRDPLSKLPARPDAPRRGATGSSTSTGG